MEKLKNNIYRWDTLSRIINEPIGSYLILCNNESILINPAISKDSDWQIFNDFPPINKIIITTPEHQCQSKEFIDRFGAYVLAPYGSEKKLKCSVNQYLKNGDKIGNDFLVLSTPQSFCNSEIGLLYINDGGSIFLADSIVNYFGIGPVPIKLGGPKNMENYIKSIKPLMEYEFDSLMLSHGNSILKSAKEEINSMFIKLQGLD